MTQNNHEWLSVLADLNEKEVPCVLITVMESKGSTPREAGTKMVVTENDQYGTIGGGNLEFQAIEKSRTLLQDLHSSNTIEDYSLGPSLAQCCGGAVSILLEPFIKNNNTVYLFGAGHVGKEVVKVLEGLPAKIKWVDQRANEFPDSLPSNTEKIISASPQSELRNIDDKSYILIMTHCHDLDLQLVETALKNRSFAYLGLIGSKTKHAKFKKRLSAADIDDKTIERLTCPIGISAVTGKHPREIAVSVAAELLSLGLTHQIKAQDNVS
jgi:xanthine dehydrogenase accessory factor